MMKETELNEKITDYCRSLGLDTMGIIRCRDFDEIKPILEKRKINGVENQFEERDIQNRISPNLFMEDGKSIISIAFPYVFNREPKRDKIYFSKYTLGQDYHKVIEIYLKKICEYIESLGGKAIGLVDSNALPERYIAKLAGIGHIGKNQMLITEKYGSYVFLGEIITDLYLMPNEINSNDCGKCNICQKACPSNALREEGCYPNVCLSYITQKKQLEDEFLLKLGGRMFGCDTCQDVCPKNKNIQVSPIKEFMPLNYMEKLNLKEIFEMDNTVFYEKYKNTSCGWRGKSLLQRNVLLNLMAEGKTEELDLSAIKSTYVKEYYNRLLLLMKL